MFYRYTLLAFFCCFGHAVFADGGDENDAGDVVSESAAPAAEGARTFELYASDKTAQGRYDRDSNLLGRDGVRVHGAFLYNEERDIIFSGGLNMDVQPEYLSGFELSLGTRAYAALLARENSDAIAFAVGIEALYTLPLRKFPLEFSGSIYYAPDIFTFGQSDRVLDWQGRVGFPLTKNMSTFVGVRFLQFDTRPGSEEIDERLHLGIRWTLGG